jgi:hypothetical protein
VPTITNQPSPSVQRALCSGTSANGLRLPESELLGSGVSPDLCSWTDTPAIARDQVCKESEAHVERGGRSSRGPKGDGFPERGRVTISSPRAGGPGLLVAPRCRRSSPVVSEGSAGISRGQGTGAMTGAAGADIRPLPGTPIFCHRSQENVRASAGRSGTWHPAADAVCRPDRRHAATVSREIRRRRPKLEPRRGTTEMLLVPTILRHTKGVRIICNIPVAALSTAAARPYVRGRDPRSSSEGRRRPGVKDAEVLAGASGW